MIAALKRAYANFRGFDVDGSTVPPMDGPLRPNAALDAAPIVLSLPDIDNLVAGAEQLACSAGNELLTLERRSGAAGGMPALAIAARQIFDHPISSLASDPFGSLAIGLDGQGVTILGGRYDGATVEGPASDRFVSVTALAFASPDHLILCNGSRHYRTADWKRDLMSKGASGSVWTVELGKPGMPATRLAGDLGFPAGVAMHGRSVIVSEAWRHSIRTLALEGGEIGTLLTGLPAYPGRIMHAAGGGYWLAMFAPRNPLVEFVLREDAYRRRMTETIDPAYWIAPSLVTGKSFLEPIQGGARKKLNILKPWAPTWSCGLVVRCDPGMRPLASYHSRADGNVHGVTSLCENDGALLVGAKGSGLVATIDIAGSGGCA